MSRESVALGQLIASRQRRACAIRKTFSLSPDPAETFAITTIKMVSEEVVQALAFGNVDAEPLFAVRWNPLSRETGELEPFAEALIEYVARALASGEIPRIWLPHQSALTIIELLGHRYKTNSAASDTLKKMGWLCHAIAEEAKRKGQQIVAVAGDLLRAHVVTGQSPVKDGHLGALMAWVCPPPGVDPALEADRRALLPASGVLQRSVDDEVERYRREAKRNGRGAAEAKYLIESRLRDGALDEWKLLQVARAAFWALHLGVAPDTEQLRAASLKRAQWRMTDAVAPAFHPHALAGELDELEFSAELARAVDVFSDTMCREQERAKGRVIRTSVMSVTKDKGGPCLLRLRVEQDVVRASTGTDLRQIGSAVKGRIQEMREDAGGSTVFVLEVRKGMRSLPCVGDAVDWTDSDPVDFSFIKKKVYKKMKDGASPWVYGKGREPKPPAPRKLDLLSIAKSLRKQ